MSSNFYELYYHFVWATKGRAHIITPSIETIIKNLIPKKVRSLGGAQYALNMVDDHIHLAATVPPTIGLSYFMNIIKGSSSHEVNVIFGSKSFYWQTGFGALSVSKKELPYIISYIENQKLHHQNNDLNAELEHIPDESQTHNEQPTERLAVQRPS